MKRITETTPTHQQTVWQNLPRHDAKKASMVRIFDQKVRLHITKATYERLQGVFGFSKEDLAHRVTMRFLKSWYEQQDSNKNETLEQLAESAHRADAPQENLTLLVHYMPYYLEAMIDITLGDTDHFVRVRLIELGIQVRLDQESQVRESRQEQVRRQEQERIALRERSVLPFRNMMHSEALNSPHITDLMQDSTVYNFAVVYLMTWHAMRNVEFERVDAREHALAEARLMFKARHQTTPSNTTVRNAKQAVHRALGEVFPVVHAKLLELS